MRLKAVACDDIEPAPGLAQPGRARFREQRLREGFRTSYHQLHLRHWDAGEFGLAAMEPDGDWRGSRISSAASSVLCGASGVPGDGPSGATIPDRWYGSV